MAYRKDQGRYVRMAAFWLLTLLVAYGALGGFVVWLNDLMSPSVNQTLIEPFPLLGKLQVSTLIGLGVLVIAGFIIHRLLNKPKVADLLIDTESELRKVTWPTIGETWQGSLAVAFTVVVLFFFLTVADVLLVKVIGTLIGL